jgi:hypothetical protein
MDTQTLRTNTKRLFTYHLSNDLEIPRFLDDILFGRIAKASALSSDQQEVLFVGGLIKIVYDGDEYLTVPHEKIRRANKEDIAEVWLDLHNRSKGDDAMKRLSHFKTGFGR